MLFYFYFQNRYKMKRIKFLLAVLLVCQFGFSRVQVDTVSIFASKMKKEVKNVVIVPENYTTRKHYPVVYLLHGYSDNYAKWVTAVPSIKNYATQFQLILVCPDGGYSSWYMDSPIDLSSQYESYITKDLITYIDTHSS